MATQEIDHKALAEKFGLAESEKVLTDQIVLTPEAEKVIREKLRELRGMTDKEVDHLFRAFVERIPIAENFEGMIARKLGIPRTNRITKRGNGEIKEIVVDAFLNFVGETFNLDEIENGAITRGFFKLKKSRKAE